MTIDTNMITLIIAFANLVLIVIGPVANAANARADRNEARRREYEEREENRRKEREISTDLQKKESEAQKERLRLERQGHILRASQVIVQQRAKLQYLQEILNEEGALYAKDKENLRREREEAYGEAYATMLFVNDNLIRNHAKDVMDINNSPDLKLTAINNAIKRLGEIFDETLYGI
jgi:hypothetical protein